MGDPSGVIERLRPLHSPAPDGSAEIFVMALVGGLAALAMFDALRRCFAQRRPLRRAARAALAASRDLPAEERLAAQARLLRDLANAVDRKAVPVRDDWMRILRRPLPAWRVEKSPTTTTDGSCASFRALHGEEWLARLDAIFATRFFRDGPGKIFGDALYQPHGDNPAETLDDALDRLLVRLDQ
jgi:hypothetical protein